MNFFLHFQPKAMCEVFQILIHHNLYEIVHYEIFSTFPTFNLAPSGGESDFERDDGPDSPTSRQDSFSSD